MSTTTTANPLLEAKAKTSSVGDYSGFVAGIFSGIAKVTGKS